MKTTNGPKIRKAERDGYRLEYPSTNAEGTPVRVSIWAPSLESARVLRFAFLGGRSDLFADLLKCAPGPAYGERGPK